MNAAAQTAAISRAFRMAFLPTPRSTRNITWTRCYVPEIGDDAANHARGVEVMRDAYPKAKLLYIEPNAVGPSAQ